ncbi:hypothetical protein TKK_0013528 [Trichogramma kaykai]
MVLADDFGKGQPVSLHQLLLLLLLLPDEIDHGRPFAVEALPFAVGPDVPDEGGTNRRRRSNPSIQALVNLATYHALVVEKVTGNVQKNLRQQRGGGRDEDEPEGEI